MVRAQPEDKQVFFDTLQIAKDGGLTEIGRRASLWYSSRYLTSAMLFLFIFYNIYFLLVVDLCSLSAGAYGFCSRQTTLDAGGYLLVKALTLQVVRLMGSHDSLTWVQENLGQNPAKAICVVELTLLAILVLKSLTTALHARASPVGSYARWRSITKVCWRKLPELSYFSAMKLLHHVTPQQASYDLNFILWYDNENLGLKLLKFVVTRVFCLVIGLDCFLMKYRQATMFILTNRADQRNVFGAVILLNQILGVVQLSNTIRRRLYRFVFAGEDGIMTHKESVREKVWEAMVVERIFMLYPFGRACALTLTWNDDDFQLLILEEEELGEE